MLYSDPNHCGIFRDLFCMFLYTSFFRITDRDIVVSPGRMVATMQVPLQSHHCEAPRLENRREFLSHLLRLCSRLKIGLIKVSVAPCLSFPCFFSLSSRVVDPWHFWYGSGCGSASSDPYLCLTDPDADSGGPKTYGSGSVTLVKSHKEVKVFLTIFAWWKDPEPDLYLWLTDPEADPGGPKTYGAGCGSGSTTLFSSTLKLKFFHSSSYRFLLLLRYLTGIMSSECRDIFWTRLLSFCPVTWPVKAVGPSHKQG